MPISSYFNELHKLLMRDVATLKVNLHGQKECEKELVPLIEAPTSIPPNCDCEEANNVANPYLGIITAI